jgi:HK97 gp10 family phage protein
LRELAKVVDVQTLKKAVKAGVEPIKHEVKLRAPRDATGNLAKSIGSTVESPDGREVVGKVGAFKPAGAHIHLVEFGTGPRFTEQGAYRGAMPAHPFMRPAWAVAAPRGLQKAIEVLRAAADRAVRS